MLSTAPTTLLLLLSTSQLVASSRDAQQVVFAPSSLDAPVHAVDDAILSALDTHDDPVAALLSLRPEVATELAEARLLHISGEEKAQWMTEGDKLRLRRLGKKFMDITDHADFYRAQAEAVKEASWSGKAREQPATLCRDDHADADL